MKRLLAPLVVILVTILPASSLDAPRVAARPPRASHIYSVFATDGYLTTPSGESLHFYGLVGGPVGAPLEYRDRDGRVQTLAGGPPLPAAGPLTPAEAALVGHAQWPVRPPIRVAAGDVVEVRLKNLGGTAADSPRDPLGLELRGLGVLSAKDAPPESSRLAAPPDAEDPSSGNVVVYLFSPPRAGTFAYGWSVDAHAGHAGHETGAATGAGLADHTTAAATGAGHTGHTGAVATGSDAAMQHAESSGQTACACLCTMDATGGAADSHAHTTSTAVAGSTGVTATLQSTEAEPLPIAADGALIVGEARVVQDGAAQTGSGNGAAGVLGGQTFDRDFVVVLPGPSGLPLYTGPDADDSTLQQPQYPASALGAIPAGGRVLVRTINPGPAGQSLDMRSYRFQVAGYRRSPLEWSVSRMDAPGWLSPASLSRQADGSVLVEAGEAYDWLLMAPEALP